METYDVVFTCGSYRPSDRDSMMEAMYGGGPARPNSYLTGRGEWDDITEYSGALLWTGLTSTQVDTIRDLGKLTAYNYGQQAIGVMVVPAGSALIYVNPDDCPGCYPGIRCQYHQVP